MNPKSTSKQSSKPCTVLQYPSRKEHKYYKKTYGHAYENICDIHVCKHMRQTVRWPYYSTQGCQLKNTGTRNICTCISNKYETNVKIYIYMTKCTLVVSFNTQSSPGKMLVLIIYAYAYETYMRHIRRNVYGTKRTWAVLFNTGSSPEKN